ncbi:uncharacterized protein BO66DRAFT_385914 [Aspergillus aculeatinus CBS 121060]|uniref:Uncharacterized protein n=4 Tax=Aspergillus TaxID=5052 RepID=A0A1L9X491_ASPA1|nr:uncharacterized protein ASPACDRAFT_114255 [Aspergillus aculeatus ATCC 16872]XP_025440752.1 hypothetical protein BO95DRAFT_416829 [Aspergillus brunneoviolaceus CBS 621.78]XP_025498096.1 hypothetical protein BO66DRAFT_385914 [Aspergillus aculeatinus CBS 121060]XP_040804096.1 uncharacterized protein BO72DRAFT_475461 [Aspergillus fijiensis CBS 313.89]OJK03293.1 hypothetical protein ASPACDRAFT_114255 [Aspergillus aculeatus ATCC 16872]RAH44231.1 hypothetical protein BO95DRAFT_416829 [Aspergillus 
MPIYLISKAADPIFAFAIGTTAALLRIQREQREKFPERAKDIGIGSVVQLGASRVQRWWAGDFAGL